MAASLFQTRGIDLYKAELLTNHVPKGVTQKHYLETNHLQYLQPEVQTFADWVESQAAAVEPRSRNIDKCRSLKQSALKNTANGRCVLCGQTNVELTGEHVPPQAAYSTKPGSELLTVPACFDCNNGTSDIDKAFGFALGLFCQRTAHEKTAGGTILFNKLEDAYRGINDKNLSSALKQYYDPYFESGTIGNPWTAWWQRDFHDPVIQKVFAGLHWLNHNGQVLADGDYYVSFTRNVDFSTSAAQKISDESFPGINIDSGQFIARHRQDFDGHPLLAGVFQLSLHFQCDQKPNAGYHVLCIAIPASAMANPVVNQFWNNAQGLNPPAGITSFYRVTN